MGGASVDGRAAVAVGSGGKRGARDGGAPPDGMASGEMAAQTGGATKRPRSGSLKLFWATSGPMGLAVPHWSATIGSAIE